ncbi:hypothetical protein TD95_003252 [Thielaviopsis punctulata]|uniref:Ribosomal protein L34 n=1 Tax=Thielaviopsis punctulata TaxID=72032 RepID=A0A0F4ZBF0_9PEZI|nr:hypothetical protein TD95_003252 [Thielaviopsis punctulata]
MIQRPLISLAISALARPSASALRQPSSIRAFSVLSPLRPGLAQRRMPLAAFTPSPLQTTTTMIADVVPSEAISAAPGLGMSQIRCGPRNTLNSNSRLKRKRRIGFLARKRSQTGRKILERRLAKGRMRLTN